MITYIWTPQKKNYVNNLKNKKSHYVSLWGHKHKHSFSSISAGLTTSRLYFIGNKGKGKLDNLLFKEKVTLKHLKKCPVS